MDRRYLFFRQAHLGLLLAVGVAGAGRRSVEGETSSHPYFISRLFLSLFFNDNE
jgi:hypothetical protein